MTTLTHRDPTTAAITQPAYLDIIAANRGWTNEMLSHLNEHSTRQLDNLPEMTAQLHHLISTGAQITIWPDYDVDGICSGTVLYAGLAELGARVNMIVPDYRGSRELTDKDVDHIMSVYPDTRAVITCDGGINSTAGLNYARHQYRLTTLVTDHHIEEAPGCVADVAVNPNTRHSTYDHRDICGAQVAYLVVEHYAATYRHDKLDTIELLRLFAGLGSLADVMPMTHRNRDDVRLALTYITMLVPEFPRDYYNRIDTKAEDKATPLNSVLMNLITSRSHHPYFSDAFKGMAYLLNELGFLGKLYDVDDFDESFIGFTLAPMFNATRRIEADMRLNMAVFTPTVVSQYDTWLESQNKTRPEALNPAAAVRQLHENNLLRREEVNRHLDNLRLDEQPHGPHVIIANQFTDQPVASGFLGLLASEVLKLTKSEAVVVLNKYDKGSGNPHYSGSGRSAGDLDLLNLHIPGVRGRGHPQACGIQVTDDIALAALEDKLSAHTGPDLSAHPPKDRSDLALIDITGADSSQVAEHHDILDVERVLDLVDDLTVLQPFGHGFAYPDITLTLNAGQCQLSTMGSEDRHMKIFTPSGLTLIKWNARDNGEIDEFAQARHDGRDLEAVVEFSINVFRDQVTAQAIIRELVYV